MMIHQIKVIVPHKYEQRIDVLLSAIVECCGNRSQLKERACGECAIRIAKCSRLVNRGQIPMLYYIELVKSKLLESNKNL